MELSSNTALSDKLVIFTRKRYRYFVYCIYVLAKVRLQVSTLRLFACLLFGYRWQYYKTLVGYRNSDFTFNTKVSLYYKVSILSRSNPPN